MTEFERRLEEEFEKQKNSIEKPNLVVVGGSGVGKSSLINHIFGSEVAKTGEGKPITSGINKYESSNIPLVFYDTEGYEIANNGTENRTNFEEKIIPEFEKMNSGKLKDQVHLVWYCISITNHRVTEYDKLNIDYFTSKGMKTAIVFTQCDNDEELENGKGKNATDFKAILEERFSGLSYFETCSTDAKILLDLELLIDWSIESLPNDQLKQSFIASQKISIKDKKKKAYEIVALTTTTTGITGGLNPIPVSDALLLAPQQLAMCMSITRLFWLNTDLSSFITDLLKTQILSLMGKQAAASLLKLIPGLGQIVNGVVAAGVTGGLGTVIVEINAKALKDYYETGQLPDWASLFSANDFIKIIIEAIKSKQWKKEI